MVSQPVEDLLDRPVPAPLLKSAVAGLVGRVPWGQVLPRSSGTEYPQDAVENVPRITPRAASPIGAHLRFRNERFDEFPLLFGEVHAILCVGGRLFGAKGFVLESSDRSVSQVRPPIYEIASSISDTISADAAIEPGLSLQ